jgi:hypothetical protein
MIDVTLNDKIMRISTPSNASLIVDCTQTHDGA